MASDLNFELSKKTHIFHLKVWVLIAIFVGLFLVFIVLVLPFCVSRKRSKRGSATLQISQIPKVSKEIKEIKVDQYSAKNYAAHDIDILTLQDKFSDKDSDKLLSCEKAMTADNSSQYDSFTNLEKEGVACKSGEKGGVGAIYNSHPVAVSSLLSGLPKFAHLGRGHWFTLRDLEAANNRFSKENVIGEGGYGVVYRGRLINGFLEFRVEVEAIGHVHQKNLVRLLGYCIEGTHRLLVYEYVNNGNLEQWLHGALSHHGYLTWEAIQTRYASCTLGYLHEAIEPKMVHRDRKSSNILVDDDFNAKLSNFGLAKLLGSGKSHITTKVMGTFGWVFISGIRSRLNEQNSFSHIYVTPEYANNGLLNEKCDVYSFGVVLLVAITGRDPVDYVTPMIFFLFRLLLFHVNLVDWLKVMVGSRCFEEVVDLTIETKPPTTALKRALLAALICVDPDAEKIPIMSQVARILESEEYPVSRKGLV
ncbi:unnamed protein product [Coffea canephora]|uniref:non-specific serine/threonine protein kinase n=1 Tax=Coffea canephora TaxID=49390 RepID=A0A068UGN0_COFCA|nr:unnamed protein product [Coffea canephora]